MHNQETKTKQDSKINKETKNTQQFCYDKGNQYTQKNKIYRDHEYENIYN